MLALDECVGAGGEKMGLTFLFNVLEKSLRAISHIIWQKTQVYLQETI